LIQTVDSSILFSAGLDGTLFIHNILEERLPTIENSESTTVSGAHGVEEKEKELKPMDPELAYIVLVQQKDMEDWILRQQRLKSDLEATKRKVESKLTECKERYQQ